MSRRTIFAAIALFAAGHCTASGAEVSPAARWPQGWKLAELAPPAGKSGERFEGSNRLALKLGPQGQPLAAINLTVLAIKPGDKPTLEDQTRSMIKTVQEGYAAKGLKSSCDAPQTTTLAGAPARQVFCHAGEAGTGTDRLQQLVIIAVAPHTVRSLSYTAPPADFATYRKDFSVVRDSLQQAD